ncbi:platelet factor 4 [Ochotona princeps]|uniref:platelet factor 4 n=1 Tax=Ochotona princeps TaxID=9978 RepID=UPI002714545B|nr:platelet factor 4 [Ochotona princeps]
MSLPVALAGPRPRPMRGLLLLGLLLLLAVVPATSDKPEEEREEDLHCVCVKTTSRVRARQVTSLELIKAGPHCPTAQLLATLKNGRKLCLDPKAPLYNKMIKKLLEG